MNVLLLMPPAAGHVERHAGVKFIAVYIPSTLADGVGKHDIPDLGWRRAMRNLLYSELGLLDTKARLEPLGPLHVLVYLTKALCIICTYVIRIIQSVTCIGLFFVSADEEVLHIVDYLEVSQ